MRGDSEREKKGSWASECSRERDLLLGKSVHSITCIMHIKRSTYAAPFGRRNPRCIFLGKRIDHWGSQRTPYTCNFRKTLIDRLENAQQRTDFFSARTEIRYRTKGIHLIIQFIFVMAQVRLRFLSIPCRLFGPIVPHRLLDAWVWFGYRSIFYFAQWTASRLTFFPVCWTKQIDFLFFRTLLYSDRQE